MWGGWYNDDVLMRELFDMRRLYEKESAQKDDALSPEVIFFADERAYSNLFSESPHLKGIENSRTAMGKTGVPFDSYMAEDAESILKKYKAAVFPMPIPSEAGKRAMELCDKMGIPYLRATGEHYELSTEEIKTFYKNSGIHLYTEENDVVYVGNGHLALHSALGGKKRVNLPKTCKISSVFGTEFKAQTTDFLEFELKENATALFAISSI